MMVVLQCPVCNSSFQVHPNQAGQRVGCPSCQQTVSVPETIAPTPVDEPEVFACPFCEGKFGVAPEMRDSEVQCPHCHKHVVIQNPNAPSTAAPTSGEEELFAPGYQAPKGDPPNPLNIRTGKKGRKKKKKIQIPPPIDEVKPPSASPAAPTPNQASVNETKDARFRKIKEPAKPAVPAPPSTKRPSPSESAPNPKPTKPSRSNQPPPSSKKNADREKSKTRFKTSKENPKPKKSTSGKAKVPPKSDADPTINITNKKDRPPTPDSPVIDRDQQNARSEPTPPNSAIEKPTRASLASIAKATTDPIDAMLPPKFTAIDPDEIRMQSFSRSKDEHKVILPDGDGGYQRVDSRVVHVHREGEKLQLYASSKDQKERKRWIQNVLAIILGIIILTLAFAILQSR